MNVLRYVQTASEQTNNASFPRVIETLTKKKDNLREKDISQTNEFHFLVNSVFVLDWCVWESKGEAVNPTWVFCYFAQVVKEK